MTTLTEMLKLTGNSFATIAEDGIIAGDIRSYTDTGSYALNGLLSGDIFLGMPDGKILGIAAESSTGKSFFALAILKNFLDQHKKAGGVALVFESESALTKQTMIDRDIDVSRVGIVPVSTVEEFRTQCIRVIDSYEKTAKKDRKPLMIVLDSLGMLSTNKETEDAEAGKDTKDMTRAQLVKGAFRILTLRAGRAGIPFIVTNHVYAAMGLYEAKKQSGGTGLQYAASIILSLSKAKDKEGDEVVGNIITVGLQKSRVTKENSKIKCSIKYDGGLEPYYYLTELAVEGKVFKKVSTQIQLPDGSKVFKSEIEKNPEKYFTEDVLNRINEYVKREYCYGKHGGDQGHE